MLEIEVRKQLLTAHGPEDLQVNLSVNDNELIAIYGESGVGKTTLLRILAGLTAPEHGNIQVDGSSWLDTTKKHSLSPQKRRVGFVFQDYALFPNMTVKGNLEFAQGKKYRDPQFVEQILQLTGLEKLKDRKPETLSGGQRQRVALARALAIRPKLLLLDEPLSALGLSMRLELQALILRIHREFGMITLLVSHSISEIHRMANRVIVLEQGQITQSGPPTEVFGSQKLSGKFRFTGEIVELKLDEVVYIITVLVGSDLVRIVTTEAEGKEFRVGDQVMLASKSLNPVIEKI